MKTFIVKNSYNSDRKITVEDDVTVSCNSYERGNEGMMVTFQRPTMNYGSDLVAAFDNCSTVYQEGADIQELNYERCEPTQEKSKDELVKKWSPLSTNA